MGKTGDSYPTPSVLSGNITSSAPWSTEDSSQSVQIKEVHSMALTKQTNKQTTVNQKPSGYNPDSEKNKTRHNALK